MRDSLDRFLSFFYSGHSDLPSRNPSPSPHILLKRGLSCSLSCASTEDYQPPSSPLFCEQRGHLAALSSCFMGRC